MIEKRCIYLFIALMLFSSHLFAQVNEIDTAQWLIFNTNPLQNGDVENTMNVKPDRIIQLSIKELKPQSTSSTSVKFVDQILNTEILIYSTEFQSDKHNYNFEKSLIDGKVAFGHDGFQSNEYVKNNFHTELAGIKIIDKNTKTEINLVNSSFPVFIHPLLANKNGECFVRLFRIKKNFKYLIVLKGGGGGAGSYENYLLIDLYNRIWIFAKDLYSDSVYFVPMSKQKDPFIKKGIENYYRMVLK